MNQKGITPKQQAKFYGLLTLVGVIVGSIAGSYLFPALGLCRQPGSLGQILGGAAVLFIIVLFHNRSLQRENAELRLINSIHELGASMLSGTLSNFGQRSDRGHGSGDRSGGVVIE